MKDGRMLSADENLELRVEELLLVSGALAGLASVQKHSEPSRDKAPRLSVQRRTKQEVAQGQLLEDC